MMKAGCLTTLVVLWTIVSVTLSLCGVGRFAEFPITAWPWHWSCLCILYWVAIACAVFLACVIGGSTWVTKKKLDARAQMMAQGKVARLIMQNDVAGAYKFAKDTWGDRIPEKVKKALMEAAQKK